MATKVPTALPMFVNTTTNRTRVILFFQKPFIDRISSLRFSKSRTFGFPTKTSTKPATHPAAIIGLSDVTGEAANTALTYGYDSVTFMQESKASICQVSKA